MYVNLFIQNSISKLDVLYTYKADDSLNIKKGTRVRVPFGKGNRSEIGIVLETFDNYNGKYRLKNIIEVLDDEPIINEELIELGFWITERYLTGFNSAFSPILPPGDLKIIEKHAEITEKDYIPENQEESELLERLRKNSMVDNFDESDKKLLQKLRENKIITLKFKIRTIGGFKKVKMVKLLNKDTDLNTLTSKHLQIYNYLLEREYARKKDLLMDLEISDYPLKKMQEKGIVEIYEEREYREVYTESYICEKHELNSDQLYAFNHIVNSDTAVSLLCGITGSGKTEVYLHLAEECIRKNGQVIILVPEIGLTPQMIERFKGRFKDRVSVLHSKLSSGERFDQWQKIKNGEVDIVVGVRSAVFAPFKNLKLIIIDEEHDSSYEFHDSLKYDTVEVALKRAELNDAKAVLGSATPDVTHYYRAINGEYNLLRLDKRAKESAAMPDVRIIDMRRELDRGNVSIFSEELAEKIGEKLKRREMIILFLNRRGFSSFVSCRSCGEVIKCDNCDISMTYHKNMDILRCHYCGATKKMVKTCPSCGSKFIKQFGTGTQKVEEEVKRLFPEARVLRMDRDTTVKKGAYDDIYAKIKNREVDILIGTQMVAKGLDFENVTLVGVIAADLSLYVQDYKAGERTFQLLTQVAGRAGRGSKRGEVIIQTYSPESFYIECAKNSDYNSFYSNEIKLRQAFKYPPFMDLVTVSFMSESPDKLNEAAYGILKEFRDKSCNLKAEHTNVIESPRINRIYKVKFTIKFKPGDLMDINEILKNILDSNKDMLWENGIFYNIDYL